MTVRVYLGRVRYVEIVRGQNDASCRNRRVRTLHFDDSKDMIGDVFSCGTESDNILWEEENGKVHGEA